ncbi:MAG: MFS transporter [Streptosporangiales bacterium]|nr:MFS transporter [Streptosporangiales bacterium]
MRGHAATPLSMFDAAYGGGTQEVRPGQAWIILAAAFAAMFSAFGIAYSYGAVVESLRADLGVGRAAGATLFSVASFAYFGLGGITGAAADRFGPRRVLLVGALAMGAGLVVTAQADSIGVALAGYGLGVGIAVACAYVPMLALVSGWYTKRRTFALGIAVTGIGLGTLAVPPAVAALVAEIGWRDTYRVLAAGGTAVLAGCAVVAQPPPPKDNGPGVRLRDALRMADYRRLYVSMLLLSLALFVPFVHLPAYVQERGISPGLAALLIGALGTGSVIGRLALGVVAGCWLLRTYKACFAVMTLSFAVWAGAGGSYPMLLLFASLLGVGYGGFVALSPAVVAARFGVDRLGSVLGVLYTGAALGSVAGPPLAGAAIDGAGHGAAIAGSLAFAAAALCVLVPFTPLPDDDPSHLPR